MKSRLSQTGHCDCAYEVRNTGLGVMLAANSTFALETRWANVILSPFSFSPCWLHMFSWQKESALASLHSVQQKMAQQITQCDSTFGCNCQSLVIFAVPQQRRSNFHQFPISTTRLYQNCLLQGVHCHHGRVLQRGVCVTPRGSLGPRSWAGYSCLRIGQGSGKPTLETHRRTSKLRSFLAFWVFLWKIVRSS